MHMIAKEKNYNNSMEQRNYESSLSHYEKVYTKGECSP